MWQRDMIQPHEEVKITLTMAELTQVVVPSLAEQPYRLVAAVLQKIGAQIQEQQTGNGFNHAAVKASTVGAVSGG